MTTSADARPDDVVGHKTFSDGHGGFRHEPLLKADADALWAKCEAAKAKRAADMPDEQAALLTMAHAYERLRELGWRSAVYCPKDGSSFQAIEPGSTGTHDCHYEGKWPDGSWWVREDGDLWPSRPCLFKLYPEDQAKKDAKWEKVRAALAAEGKE